MTTPPRPRLLRALVRAVLLGAGVPLGVALLVNARRPDLTEWVRSRTTGLWLMAGVAALCVGATGVFLAAEIAPFAARAPRRVMTVAGLLLCTLPALLALLLGPMLIAFMYGAAG